MGELVLAYQALARPAAPDHLVLAYTAGRGSPTEERLQVLMSWHAGAAPVSLQQGDAQQRTS